MASTNFLQFDVNQTNMLNDTAYSSNTQRQSGVVSGIASSTLYNKAQFQSSTMSKALADLLVNNGINAMDNNLSGLVAGLDQLMAKYTNKIGEIIQVVCTSSYVPDGCLPCNGSEYTKAMFSDLWNNYLTSSPAKLNVCTYEQYQTAIAQVGFCDKFAVDTTNQKFKVPLRNTYRKIIKTSRNTNPGYNLYDDGWIEQWGFSDNAGQGTRTVTITLPVAMMDTNYFVFRTEGRAAAGNAPGTAWISGFVDPTKSATSFQFSTDQYSYVHGDCWKVIGYSNVDVSSITAPREFVVVSNGQINQSQMDWSQWASSLSGKMNADLSNMNATYTAKENIIGWSMPDFTAKIETQNTTYTAPSKGWIYVTAQGAELKVSINGSQLAHGTRGGIYYNVCYSLPYMVNAGDVIAVTGAEIARETPLIAFYPCKGASSGGGGSVSTEPLYRCYSYAETNPRLYVYISQDNKLYSAWETPATNSSGIEYMDYATLISVTDTELKWSRSGVTGEMTEPRYTAGDLYT